MKPRMILAGGGGADDSLPLDERFAEWTGDQGKMLYLPIAMDGQSRSYTSCLDWVSGVFRPLGITDLHMWTELSGKDVDELESFTSIYIGGGNTFRLLSLLRASAFDQALVNFVNRGGAVYGGSAGAIVLGRDILTCAHMDLNDAGLVDTRGLDLVDGYAIWCHYRPEDDERIAAYVADHGIPVLALSERAGVQVDNGHLTAAGFDPIVRFTPHTWEVIDVNEQIP